MVAFTISSGILKVGDTVTLGKMGRHILSCFVGLSFVLCAFVAALVIPFLRLHASGNVAQQASQLGQISQMFFGILPTNPVDPFQVGNAMQMPPIPGAGLLVYTILFARLGIPAEALVLATAIDVAVDYCGTGFNVLLLMLQIVYQGKALGSIDREILMKQGDENAA